MKKNNSHSIFLLIYISLFSCTLATNLSIVQDQFEHFLHDNLIEKKNHKTDDLYLCLPLDICKGCLKKVKFYLEGNDFKSNVHLVISSNTNKQINFFLSERLRKKFDIIFDNSFKIKSQLFYESSKAYFFYFRDNQLINYFTFGYENNIEKFFFEMDKFLLVN